MKRYMCLLFIFLISCSKPSKLEQALQLAEDNRAELEKVLNHYEKNIEDTLKLKAAIFLIENMPGHFSLAGNELTEYYDELEMFLNRTPVYDYRDSKRIRDSINMMAPKDQNIHSKVRSDIQYITSDFLIKNIDRAFDDWRNNPWAQHLNFDDFCEYLLPYNVDNYFMIEDWRTIMKESIREDVLYKLKTFHYSSELRNSTYWACKTINKYLRETICPDGSPLESPSVYRLSTLIKIPYGTCADRAPVTLAVMRSLGIPVMIDFTYQWPFRSLGHTWNIVLMSHGQNASFGGGEEGPGELHMPGQRMAKVFRKTYAMNEDILRLKSEVAYVPSAFQNALVKDVTTEYMQTATITVPVKWGQNQKYAYLAVFNDKEWIPVCYGKKKGNSYVFENIGKDIVYLPVYYTAKGIEPFSDPFLLDLKGDIHCLSRNHLIDENVKLFRKFGLSEVMYNYAWTMVSGKIEASQKEDFSQSVVMHTIDKWSVIKDSVTFNNPVAYRFWRYVAPPYGRVNLSKLAFYEKGNHIPNCGRVIGTDETYFIGDTATTKYEVFNEDPLTYFESSNTIKHPWVGMDFGKPVFIEKIIYAPRNDDNNIRYGDLYELLYWEKDRWISLGKKTGENPCLLYKNIPQNALFLLRNLSRGKEERIFTIYNGEQVFW